MVDWRALKGMWRACLQTQVKSASGRRSLFLWHLDHQHHRDEQSSDSAITKARLWRAQAGHVNEWTQLGIGKAIHLDLSTDGNVDTEKYLSTIRKSAVWEDDQGPLALSLSVRSQYGMDGEEASWTVHGNGVTTLPTTHCQQGRWGALRLPHLIVKRSYTEFYMMSANLKIFRFLKDTNKTPGKVAFNLYAVNLKSLIWFNSLSFFFF